MQSHLLTGEALDEFIRSALHGSEGIETSVVEVSKEFPLAEAVVSLQRAPPGIVSVTISPPLEEGAEAWLVVGRVSVRLEDILAVPDWVERRSLAARIMEEWCAGAGLEALPAFVDHIRYEDVRVRIKGEVRLADHTLTVRGLNVLRREEGLRNGLEWFMF
jgi:hypothetical protein